MRGSPASDRPPSKATASTWCTSLGLAPDLLGPPLDVLGITELPVASRPARIPVVELEDPWHAGRDLQFGDLAVRDVLQVLDQRPERVAVGGEQNDPPGPQVG